MLPIEKKENQCRAIQHEFEPVGCTMLKNPLVAGWGLLPTLHLWFECVCVRARYLMIIWWMVFIVNFWIKWGYVGSQGLLCFCPLLMQ
jgi:hypothetical protein